MELVVNPCLSEEYQDVFSTKKYDYKKSVWFKEDVITLSAQLTTLFGFAIDHKMYIYQLNFSSN